MARFSFAFFLNALLISLQSLFFLAPLLPAVHASAQSQQESVDIARTYLQTLDAPKKDIKTTSGTGLKKGIVQTVGHYGLQFIESLVFSGPSTPGSSTVPKNLDPKLKEAVISLENTADSGNSDAIFLLAEMNFHGNFTHPRNFTTAFSRYNQLASLYGNSSAQYMIGFMYATGIGGVVEQDQARATLYYQFAAEHNNTKAQMVLGYRHLVGISVPKSCDTSVEYYREVADKAMAWLRSGPPGGHAIIRDAYRIADEEGGVYGEGASVSSAGINSRFHGATANSDQHADFQDVLEYLDLMSRKGDLKATMSLGRIHYEGSRGYGRDLVQAKKEFLTVARKVWPASGKKAEKDISEGTKKVAAKAAGYLGRMFLRGEGVTQDYKKAMVWFKRGIQHGDGLSQYSLGLIHLNGYGVPKNPMRAAELFGPAADQDMASAQVRLGALFLDQGDVQTAYRYFELAVRTGHIEAYYYLAAMAAGGVGRDKSCHVAAAYYKTVCEKAETLVASFDTANDAYAADDIDTALINYMLAAEQGFESAQANVAYLIDKALPRKFLQTIGTVLPALTTSPSSLTSNPRLALLYWTRSAKQHNIDSRVKMGDYYLNGIGMRQNNEPDASAAAACYQAAAEGMQSAQAMWNLGWMHENGIGIDQDFHLAKRFYDQALETNREAYLPVKLALLKLRLRSAWNTLTNGRIKSIEDEPVHRPKRSFMEWLTAFLEADLAAYENAQLYDHPDGAEAGDVVYDDDWTQMPGGDGNIEDLWDELGLEGVMESLAIVACAVGLGFLVLLRRRRQDEREREERRRLNGQGLERVAQMQIVDEVVVIEDDGAVGVLGDAPGLGQDGDDGDDVPIDDPEHGLFPPPGDPNYPGWVAGGVGH